MGKELGKGTWEHNFLPCCVAMKPLSINLRQITLEGAVVKAAAKAIFPKGKGSARKAQGRRSTQKQENERGVLHVLIVDMQAKGKHNEEELVEAFEACNHDKLHQEVGVTPLLLGKELLRHLELLLI